MIIHKTGHNVDRIPKEGFVDFMEVMSKFVERLDELMFDHHITVPELAEALGIYDSTIYNYNRESRHPKIEVLIRMANYFQCSIDFLLGLEAENTAKTFKKCPPFNEQLKFLLEYFHTNKHRVCVEVPITHSVIYAWQSGQSFPALDYVLKLANYFGCSVDFILGREN